MDDPRISKDVFLHIRLSPAEAALFGDAAREAGLPISSWARERLLIAARRELGQSNGSGRGGKEASAPRRKNT